MVARTFHEGKACDAVLRRIEAREMAVRRDVIFPEREHHAGPVELICNIGAQKYAVQHTIIEPINKFFRVGIQV